MGEKAVVAIVPPLPPGCMTTVWGDDERFVKTYFSTFSNELVYSTFDWGIRDADGYYFILGRTDDVINVAGHRLGTREIEEAINVHANIAECAVVGVADPIKGQMPLAFAVAKDGARLDSAEGRRALEQEVMDTVDRQLGAIARPRAVHFVTLLPKTRSGKTLRRAIQALAEGREPGRPHDDRGSERPGADQSCADLITWFLDMPEASGIHRVAPRAAADLQRWAERDWTDALQLESMAGLERLAVRTRNTTYDITVLSPRTGDVLVRGGRFFPVHTRARLAGASAGGGFLKVRAICPGFLMELLHGERNIITTRVQSVTLIPDTTPAQ